MFFMMSSVSEEAYVRRIAVRYFRLAARVVARRGEAAGRASQVWRQK
jgi:hypothetical protein